MSPSHRSIARLVIASSLALLAGCSDSRAESVIIVAAEGGTVESPGTFAITIPPSSLAADTEIGLETASISAYPALEGANDQVVVLTPEGTTLELAATLTLDASLVGASVDQSVAVFQLRDVEGTRTWGPIESTFLSNGSVTVSVTRFMPLAVVVTDAGALGEIRGTMRWGDETPVDGAPMVLWGNDVMVGEATTDANGNFSFPGLEAGTYSVQVDYECTISETVTLSAGMTAELALTLCGGS